MIKYLLVDRFLIRIQVPFSCVVMEIHLSKRRLIAGFLAFALLIMFYAGYSFLSESGMDEDHPQDIVLITVDTLRADYIDCEDDYNNTPNMCDLKEDSTYFEHAYTPSSYTMPAMAGVMTGKYPWKVDMVDFHTSYLPEDVETLPEKLDGMGYHNVGVYEIAAVSPEYGFDRGFDVYEENHVHPVEPDYSLDGTMDLPVDHLERDQTRRFTYFHLFGPHQPFRGSQECLEFSLRLKDEEPVDVYDADNKSDFSKKQAEECYREAVSFSDKRVGKIIESLENNERYEDSLIILTSDHGEGLWDNEIFTHTWSTYQEQLHVPLYVKYPNSDTSNRVDGSYARLIDIKPAILCYLDSDKQDPLKEVSKGNKTIEKFKAISADSKAVVKEDMKLIQNFRHDLGDELYNITKDPYEENNLYDDQDSHSLKELMPEVELQIEREEDSNEEEKHEEALIDQLKELGYLN